MSTLIPPALQATLVDNNEYDIFSNSICFTNITEEQREQVIAIGISGVICFFVLLLPILVLEAHYIFGHRSNFLLRLFFYMTLSATLLDAVYASYIIKEADFLWMCSITDYALYVQVILMLAINFVLLTMMYKYIRGVRIYSTNNICCAHPKANELIFVVCLFVLPLIVPLIEIVMQQKQKNIHVRCTIDGIFYTLVAIALILCVLCTVLLTSWFVMMIRNDLLRNRIGLLCREMSLFIWFIVFVLLWGVATIIEALNLNYAWYAIFPIVQTITPVSFFIYIWLTYGQKRKTTVHSPHTLTHRPHTLPLSSRVSLDSDTNKRALIFLSPSTSEPTEVTPLVNNGTTTV